MQKYAIFGAGHDGGRALEEIRAVGDDAVCFIDNSPLKVHNKIKDIDILSLGEYIEQYKNTPIVIATRAFPEIIPQLEQQRLKFRIWTPLYTWYGKKDKLIENPYEYRSIQYTEKDALKERKNDEIDLLSACTEVLMQQKPLFNHIEIETYNRCNGGCEFCPVSVKNDIRPERTMSEELFKKIIDELSTMDYHGGVALFSNNEPFLDSRIIEFCKYAREKVPHAKTHLFTNGTLLKLNMFVEVIDYLDELIIDNYNVDLQLIPNNLAIKKYCEEHLELREKVTIVMRHPKEVLESRGGQAPNKKRRELFTDVKCTHPFRQMIIRPDGKVSICCNDALGETDMGDVNENTLVEIWKGEKFENVRKNIQQFGRGGVEFCRYCDSMILV